ncbi:serine hydrolase [Hymenobacter rigui]|nr:serine hydrolase [Hymenobacter rigui]
MKSCLFALLVLIVSPAFAQKAAVPEARLLPLLDSAGVPGVSMAVISQKGVVWAKGLGVREAGKPQPVDAQTVFSAASLSKPVFAYLVLKLVDAGKLNLDKPLYQYVPYRALEHDARGRRITARMVLTHQSGLPNWRNGQLNFIADPGQRFSYSGEGFVYLQGVVMTVMGKNLEELAQQYVFQPLGMSRSSYQWQPAFEANHASPHNRFGEVTPLTRFTEPNAAYSLQTTAADYGRFLVALLNGQGLQPATAQALFTPQVATGRTLHDTTQASTVIGWGLGVGLAQKPHAQAFWHWGDNGDFRCFAYVSRTRGQGMVYFTNSRAGLSLLAALPARVLGQSVRPVADFLQYDAYQSPPVQVSRRVLKVGPEAAAGPFLKPTAAPQLAEVDVLDIAEHLTEYQHPAQANALLALGTAAYPNSAAMVRASAYGTLKQGNYPAATAALRRYLAMQPTDATAAHLLAQLTTPDQGNVTLRVPGFADARLVTLAGSFNAWQPLYTLFRKEGSQWRCTLPLAKGRYTYRLVVDGRWQPDPSNPNTEQDSNGNTNSVLVVE